MLKPDVRFWILLSYGVPNVEYGLAEVRVLCADTLDSIYYRSLKDEAKGNYTNAIRFKNEEEVMLYAKEELLTCCSAYAVVVK